jgi:hypothetical protein
MVICMRFEMTSMRRTALAVALAGAGLFAMTACGPAAGTTSAGAQAAAGAAADVGAEAAADLGAEAKALAEVGVDTQADPEPAAGQPGLGPKDKDRRIPPGWRKRALLRQNTLHGEVVVQTREGARTIVVQRGTVTAITETSVTVKSPDGFTLTWTFGDKLRVIEHRKKIETDAISTGDEIGVAGAREGDKTIARLLVRRVK